MGGMNFNKIFAAILVAGILAMFGGFIAKQLVHPHKLAEPAFNIDVVEVAGPGGAAPMPEPILALIAAADVAKGEKIAKACAACHTFNKGGANGVGPNLYGVLGGPKDHAAGYAYSGALKEVGGGTWTYAELNKFLWKPKAYAKGTKMAYAGLKKPDDRAALLAWLRTQADSPKALPAAGEISAEAAELTPPAVEETPAEGTPEAAQDAKVKEAPAEAAKDNPPAAAQTPAKH